MLLEDAVLCALHQTEYRKAYRILDEVRRVSVDGKRKFIKVDLGTISRILGSHIADGMASRREAEVTSELPSLRSSQLLYEYLLTREGFERKRAIEQLTTT